MANPAPQTPSSARATVEFSVPVDDRHLLDKLVAYAQRIGVTMYLRDQFDPAEVERWPGAR